MQRNVPLSLLPWLLVGAALLSCLWWLMVADPVLESAPSPTQAIPGKVAESSAISSVLAPPPSPSPYMHMPGTIAASWDWSNIQANSTAAAAPVFDVEAIYRTLQRVRLDESGHLILDPVALQALNQALDYSGVDWTEANLKTFQDIVQQGLPATAGEQAVQLIGDFHQYLNAKQQWLELMGDADSMADHMAGFEALVELRRTYLGEEVARQLFAQEEAEARYMIQSMAMASDLALSTEDKRRRQQSLHQALSERVPAIPDWEARYQYYAAEKARLLQSGLPPADVQQQMNELLDRHFTLAEQAQAAHLKLDQLR
ncbi:lipase secretion chaperone [Ketobacter sp.]|uniref:lipase secretion chaperone n=1 Tax=Ketobacter sp. TaxID=2083498 RepID=UPI000F16BAD2|nr:lipase secretion chaperone [Ketobacter sp.]RLU01075.1 MAG: hypothetical protein D9N14_03745 [Ketobacter sp.]